MNFYINASPLQFPNWSGVQLYTFRILDHMSRLAPEHTFHLHLSLKNPPPQDPRLAQLLARKNLRPHYHPGALRSYAALPLSLLKTRAAAYYLMNGDGHLRIPVPCPTAAVIHDCGRYVLPHYYGITDPEPVRLRTGAHLRKRHLVITVSETIKKELISLFNLDPARIVVAPNAVELPPASETLIPPADFPAAAPFFLMVNPGRPYKNWQDVLAAFALYLQRPDAHPTLNLILAGELRTETDALHKTLAAHPQLAARTRLLGYVTTPQLHWLYAHAQALVMPSRYEGFGVPILEAMAHHTPVIIADVPILKEVAHDAALAVPLDHPQALADALHQLLSTPALRHSLAARGDARVTAYSWQSSAQITLDSLLALAQRPAQLRPALRAT